MTFPSAFGRKFGRLVVPHACFAFLCAAVFMFASMQTPVHVVSPVVETDPVPHGGDAADDPAIWIHPTRPELSTIIGTDKKGGLAVYDLRGRQIQYLPDGRMNNVDVRRGFMLAGKPVDLVVTGNRTDNSIGIYRVHAATGRLDNVASRNIRTLETYGSCLYRSTVGPYYYFVNDKAGRVEQWQLLDDGKGRVDARLVRKFSVGSTTEGCVADDEAGNLYISEEDVGIWKYGAEPDAGTARTLVDRTGSGGHLTSNVEGLALVHGVRGTGYLVASSQGNSSYALYRRESGNQFIRSFRIAAGNGIDEVTETDGLDATASPLGPLFPNGLLVVQDGRNDRGNQNFKLIPWQLVVR